MKLYFLLLLFLPVYMLAKSEASCYTVQLKSFVIKDPSSYRFKEQGYPPGCVLIQSPVFSSVRCGCFEGYAEAKELKSDLRQTYPDSAIVTTYKKYFSGKQKSALLEELPEKSDEQELKLLFQVFSYSSDHENAYLTAKKALKRYPKSLYWHQKMAEVARWTDRREEAVEHMMYIYRHTYDKALEEEILAYSLSAYQYKTATLIIEKKVRKDPSEENVQKMVYIFDLVGRPMESAEILKEVYQKHPKRQHLLTQQLQIYLNMGEMERAGSVVQEIEDAQMKDMDSAFLLSYYYFLKNNIDASYSALKKVDVENEEGNATRYYMQVSDLAWYLQRYQEGAEASVKVDEANASRLVDYERIMSVYKKDEPARAMQAALDAYEKFKENYLFYTYAYMAIEKKEYVALLYLCESVESDSGNTLVFESLYWMIKAQTYAGMYQQREAEDAFETALRMAPDSNQVIESFIWFLMDVKADSALFKLLVELEEREELDAVLWLPMAVAYFNLQYGDRAAYYLDRFHHSGRSSRDSLLLNAYIKQSQGEEGAFYKQMRSLYADLETEQQKDPRLKHNAEFMQVYLTVSMFMLTADSFEQKLKRAKPVLTPKGYAELSLSFSLKENVDEQVHQMALQLREVEPWVRLNLALTSDDRTTQQDILHRYYRILPLGDSLSAAGNTNQISLAQDIAFEGLEHNEKNDLLYDQMRQLHNEYADYFLLNTGYLDRSGLAQGYADMHNSYYLTRGYSFEADLFSAVNSINDDEIFKYVPSTSTAFGIGIKKRFERGFYALSAGVKSSADSYTYLAFKYNTQISRRISLELLADKGAKAEESVYLLVGGFKDRIALQASYLLLGSSQFDLYLESAQYASDDGKKIGSGTSGRVDFSYLQRSAYPDISITPYYTFGDYTQSGTDRGVIEDMPTFADTNVISDDFWYAGVDLSYGMENRYNYVRVWRPYFSLNPYYNGRESKYNYGFSLGAGGEVFGQDNLSVGAEYSESVGGTSDQLWRIGFRYKILY